MYVFVVFLKRRMTGIYRDIRNLNNLWILIASILDSLYRMKLKSWFVIHKGKGLLFFSLLDTRSKCCDLCFTIFLAKVKQYEDKGMKMKTDKQQSDKKLPFLRSEFAVGWTVWKISLCPGIEISFFAEWYNKTSPESKLTMKVLFHLLNLALWQIQDKSI